MRPGELDALKLTDLDFTPGAESIQVQRQWNAKEKRIKPPKNDSIGIIAMVDPLRDRLLKMGRESEWAFTTIRGTHYRPSTRNHHWNRVRAACGSATRRCTSAPGTTSPGTCSTSRSSPTTSSRSSSATPTAAR